MKDKEIELWDNASVADWSEEEKKEYEAIKNQFTRAVSELKWSEYWKSKARKWEARNE